MTSTALVRSLVLRGTGDLLWLRPDQWRGPREDRMIALVAEAIAQGRRSRAIYPVRALHDAPAALAGRLAVGEEVRLLPELPTRLLVDRRLPRRPARAARLRRRRRSRSSASSGVVEAMTLWFEVLWERAVVPDLEVGRAARSTCGGSCSSSSPPGVHDEQIARRLGHQPAHRPAPRRRR